MSKSSFLNDKMLDKSRVAIICIAGMFAGFLVSRVALSFFMFVFGLNGLRGVPVRTWGKQKWWLLGMAWVGMYAVSGLWSADLGEWGQHVQVKLPFLLLPLAFAWQPKFTDRQVEVVTLSMAVMLLIAAGYSVGHFLSDPAFYIKEYKVSHMLPTLPKKDHIRSSMASALFVIWAVYAWPRITRRSMRWLTGICIGLVIAYIHILAAKSGLIALYIFLLAWGVYMLFTKGKRLGGALILIAIPTVIYVASLMVPTLRERITYIGFTIFMYTHNEHTENLGDISRLVSYQIAGDLIKEHPWTGVGAGDMKHEMDAVYAVAHPEMGEYSRLLPHNQFLTVALACGIPAMLLFMAWVIWPLGRVRRNRAGFFFVMTWVVLLMQLMIEPVLEIQYGVFVYLFFLLLQMQELRKDEQETANVAVS